MLLYKAVYGTFAGEAGGEAALPEPPGSDLLVSGLSGGDGKHLEVPQNTRHQQRRARYIGLLANGVLCFVVLPL